VCKQFLCVVKFYFAIHQQLKFVSIISLRDWCLCRVCKDCCSIILE